MTNAWHTDNYVEENSRITGRPIFVNLDAGRFFIAPAERWDYDGLNAAFSALTLRPRWIGRRMSRTFADIVTPLLASPTPDRLGLAINTLMEDRAKWGQRASVNQTVHTEI